MTMASKPHEVLELADAAVLMKPSDVAHRWGVSTSMVTRLLRDGRLHGLRVGKLWRIRIVDVEEFESRQMAAIV